MSSFKTTVDCGWEVKFRQGRRKWQGEGGRGEGSGKVGEAGEKRAGGRGEGSGKVGEAGEKEVARWGRQGEEGGRQKREVAECWDAALSKPVTSTSRPDKGSGSTGTPSPPRGEHHHLHVPLQATHHPDILPIIHCHWAQTLQFPPDQLHYKTVIGQEGGSTPASQGQ